MLLHGYGSNENDLFAFAEYLHPSLMVFHFVRLMPYRWWVMRGIASILMPNKGNGLMMRKPLVRANWSCSFWMSFWNPSLSIRSQVHLLGFSQGAILSYALGLTYPKRFASVIALSGYLNENITPIATARWCPCALCGSWLLGRGGAFWLGTTFGRTAQTKGFVIQFDAFPVGHTVGQDGFYKLLEWQNALLDRSKHPSN